MSIASVLSRDVGRKLEAGAIKETGVVARDADRAGAKILDDAHPLLKLVLGQQWADFVTKPRLPDNAGDRGPRWLTAITSRLDGQQREAVGLSIRGDASLPTPLPGLTIKASGGTGATLRRTPLGKLQLIYSTQLDGGVAAQIRAGLTGGVEIGHFGLQVQGIAQAGAGGQAAEDSLLTYELDPKNAHDMTALAKQLQGHLVVDSLSTRLELRAERASHWARALVSGKAALADPPPAPGSLVFSSDFARQHLAQASFNRSLQVNASAGVSAGVGGDASGKLGIGADAELMGNHFTKAQPGQISPPQGGWQKIVGDGIGLLSGLVTPNASGGAKFGVGLEHTLDFSSGRYLRTTQALTSDRSLFANEGGFGLGLGQLSDSGRRYAVTFSPEGLVGVDRSVASTVKNGLKEKALLQDQLQQNLDSVLLSAKGDGHDALLATYTLKDANLSQLKALPVSQVAAELPKVFSEPDAFHLARLVSEHDNNFNVGGSFGIGAGLFTGAGVNVDADLSTEAVDTTGANLVDKPSPDSPWVQGNG